MKSSILLIFIFCLFLVSSVWGQQKVVKIVILGSSSAAGGGASSKSKGWVDLYRSYVQSVNEDNEVINLAAGGYKTFQVMPTGFVPPWGAVDTARNITKALSYNPDAIIINLPSNDAVSEIPVSEQLSNYAVILELADAQKVPVWISTTQPRWISQTATQILKDMKDSTYIYFGDMALDFWTGLALESGKLDTEYDSGDYTHLNDKGHKVLFNRVVDAGILEFLTGSFLQAEDYSQASNVEAETEYIRNSNRGFIRIKKNTNASLTYRLKAECNTSLDLQFRYLNQNKTISGELFVNGVSQHSTLNFDPTKSEVIWNKISTEVELAEGENIIELKFSEQKEDICLDFIEWDNNLVSYELETSNNELRKFNEEMAAFPVPFNERITISGIPENSCIRMYSVLGIKTLETKCLENQINLNTSEFQPGLYFLHVVQDGFETGVLKVIKE